MSCTVVVTTEHYYQHKHASLRGVVGMTLSDLEWLKISNGMDRCAAPV